MSAKQAVWTSQSEDVRIAWQRQVIEAAGDPKLAAVVNAHQEELWPQFAAYYERLRALLRRALRRKLPVSLAGAALLALGQGEALAATIVVDGVTCTLVDAILAANTDAMSGGCSAGSGADTLDLQADVTLNNYYTYAYDGDTGLPVVTSEITIAGNCTGNPEDRCTIERDSGAVDFRLLAVAPLGNLTLDNLTLSGGRLGSVGERGGGAYIRDGDLTVTNNSTLSGNSASGGGGGLSNHGGTVIVTDSTISGNSAGGASGGGIENRNNGNTVGTVTITNSILSDNRSGGGGGLFNFGGAVVTITNSIISGNSATGTVGGGLDNRGTVTITNSAFFGNFSRRSGGIENSGIITVINSTLSANSCLDQGGGMSNLSGTAIITNSTISGNSASGINDGRGGGIFSFNSTVTITNSTLFGNSVSGVNGRGGGAFNTSSTVTLAGSLISGNTASSSAQELYNSSGTINANNYNLLGHSGLTNAQAFSGFSPGLSDITATSDGTNPTVLGSILDTTLAANGGPTLTHDLVSGSPAINAVPVNGGGAGCVTTDPDGNPLTTDQRGFVRPAGAACDIGAFELGMGGPGPNLGENSQVKRGAEFGENFSLGNNSTLGNHARASDNVTIGNDSIVNRSAILGDNVTVGDNSTLGNHAQVGDNVTIGNNSTVKRSAVLGDNVTVGDNTLIKNHTRIGNNVQIGDFTTIGRSAVIGDNTMIGPNVVIASHVKIGAGTMVDDGTMIADTGTDIGMNVVIGANVTIEARVKIGDGATIAADAVVPRGTVIPDGASFP